MLQVDPSTLHLTLAQMNWMIDGRLQQVPLARCIELLIMHLYGRFSEEQLAMPRTGSGSKISKSSGGGVVRSTSHAQLPPESTTGSAYLF